MWETMRGWIQVSESHSMIKSSNGNMFHVTGPLCGEFTGHQWIPLTKASGVELWFFFDLDAGDLRHHRAHYGITVMQKCCEKILKVRFTHLNPYHEGSKS